MKHHNIIRSSLLVAALLLMSAFVLMPVAAAATTVHLNPVDTTASPGTTGHIVDIVIDTTESIAGADIWLDYDSSVAEITAVTAVNFAGISYTTPIATANTNNQMRINWADVSSPKTGNGLVYARITFSAAGSAGYTDLDLSVNTMSDPGLGAISATAQDGSFTVTGTPVTIVRLNPVDTTALPGTTGHIVDIVIDTTESIAGADIWLDYSSSVAEITAVTAVNFAGISYTTPIATANTNNQMRINWADVGSPKTGNGLVYARITFSAAGSAGYTDLDLTVNTMSDPGLGAISATAQDGSFTVTGTPVTIVRLNPVDTTALPGTTGHIVDIVIDTTESIAGADIWLDYDSSVAEITAVTAVNFAGISYTTPIATANTNNQMRINWADVGSPKTGNGLVYARITFSAAGSAGYTDLDLTVNTMSDPGLGAISATAQDGSFTVEVTDLDPQPDITAPTHGTTIGGTVTVSANDLSSEGDIEYCLFEYIGGSSGLICNDTNGVDGWSCSNWDTTTVPDGQNYIIRATMGDTAGHTGTGQITVYVYNPCACDFCLELNEGLNFVSVPKTLIDSPRNATDVFNLSMIDGEFCLYYDACECPRDRWKENSDVDVLQCQGYWVNKSKAETICLNFNPAASPREQELCVGWNMIGHIDVTGMWIYDGTDTDFGSITGLENPDNVKLYMSLCGWNGGFECYPTGSSLTHVYPGDAYWILMKQDATMYGQP